MISIRYSGSFKNIERFLKKNRKSAIYKCLNSYGERGVDALSSYTPIDTGKTASMWRYEVHESNGTYELSWHNDNVNDGVNIALLIQYGHGTRNGGYVIGVDYINPALKPVFDQMASDIWSEVKSI